MERLFFKDQAIESSNLESLTYDSDDENLIIKFKGGGEYKYKKVLPEVVENFLKSESKGKYFHASIKGKYEFEKVVKEKKIEEAAIELIDRLIIEFQDGMDEKLFYELINKYRKDYLIKGE